MYMGLDKSIGRRPCNFPWTFIATDFVLSDKPATINLLDMVVGVRRKMGYLAEQGAGRATSQRQGSSS